MATSTVLAFAHGNRFVVSLLRTSLVMACSDGEFIMTCYLSYVLRCSKGRLARVPRVDRTGSESRMLAVGGWIFADEPEHLPCLEWVPDVDGRRGERVAEIVAACLRTDVRLRGGISSSHCYTSRPALEWVPGVSGRRRGRAAESLLPVCERVFADEPEHLPVSVTRRAAAVMAVTIIVRVALRTIHQFVCQTVSYVKLYISSWKKIFYGSVSRE